ncbi:MAG: hypothetical protein RML12_05455 [Xanthomonadales bacterium]|nr:hypothetical protein [Xanthomonadales bacterium]
MSNSCGASFSAPTLTWSIGALANGATADLHHQPHGGGRAAPTASPATPP